MTTDACGCDSAEDDSTPWWSRPSVLIPVGSGLALAVGLALEWFVEEAAALAFLYSIVEALEDAAMGRARSGLRSQLALLPATATVVDPGGTTRTTSVESLVPGDLMRLSAGERLATDGVVRSGSGNMDVSAITGTLGLAGVVLMHEVAEVVVILNGLRAAGLTLFRRAGPPPVRTPRLSAASSPPPEPRPRVSR